MVDLKRLFPDYEDLGDIISSPSSSAGKQTKVEWVRYYTGQQRILKTFYGRDLLSIYSKIKNINNRHVIKVYDCIYDEVTKNTYVIEESIDGIELRTYIRENGRLSQDESVRILKQICIGLETLHGLNPPVIHNDIKPANVMLRSSGDAVLIDFDISREVKSQSYSKNTQAFGSLGYTSPEHHGNFGQTTPASDVYSLGLVLHDMLTGTIQDYDEEIDDPENDKGESLAKRQNTFYNNILYQGPLRPVIEKCLSLSPEERYKDAKALRVALESEGLTKVQEGNKQNKKFPIILVAFPIIIGLIYFLGRAKTLLPEAMHQPTFETESISESQPVAPTSAAVFETEEVIESLELENNSVESTVAEYNMQVIDEKETSLESHVEVVDSDVVKTDDLEEAIQNESVAVDASTNKTESITISTLLKIEPTQFLALGKLPDNKYAYVFIKDKQVVLADSDGNETVVMNRDDYQRFHKWAILYDNVVGTSYLLAPVVDDAMYVYKINPDLSLDKIGWTDSISTTVEHYSHCDFRVQDDYFVISEKALDCESWEGLGTVPGDYYINGHYYDESLYEWNTAGERLENPYLPKDEFIYSPYCNEDGTYYLHEKSLKLFDGNQVVTVADLSHSLFVWNDPAGCTDLLVIGNSVYYYDSLANCLRSFVIE